MIPHLLQDYLPLVFPLANQQLLAEAIEKAAMKAGSMNRLSEMSGVSATTLSRIRKKHYKTMRKETFCKLQKHVAPFLPDGFMVKNPGRDKYLQMSSKVFHES